MKPFTVTVRTTASSNTYTAHASSSFSAFESAAESCGDVPCGITVVPNRPS